MKKILLLSILASSFVLNAQWENFTVTTTPELGSDQVRSVVKDNNGILWFGTANGLASFNGSTWTRYTESESLPDNNINQIFLADQGASLLLSTGSGAAEADVSSGFGVSETFTTSNSGIYDNIVYATGQTPEDIKAFGTSKGLSLFNNSLWTSLSSMGVVDSVRLADNPVSSIQSHGEHSFIATKGAGIYLGSNEVDGISFVTNWVYPYNIFTSDNVTSAFVDSEGTQWYGGDQGVISHTGIEAQAGWSDPITTAEGLPDNNVNAIFEDSYGNMWFGTNNGVAVMKTDETWSVFSTADGLIDNLIHDITEDNDNRIWFATEAGVSRFSPPWVSGNNATAADYLNLQLHPNPATDGIWIKYNIVSSAPLNLSVYDISGKKIAELKDEYGPQGAQEYFWNLRSEDGTQIHTGIYFVRIRSGALVTTKKMVVLH